MNGYVEAGYVVVFATLFAYAVSVVGRERAALRRVRRGSALRTGSVVAPHDAPASASDDQPLGETGKGPRP